MAAPACHPAARSDAANAAANAVTNAANHDGKLATLCFALGSCRYSGTPLERSRADAAFADLLQHLQQGSQQRDQQIHQQPLPAFCLMMGDQIYVDSTAGVLDGQARLEMILERYIDAYNSRRHARCSRCCPVTRCWTTMKSSMTGSRSATRFRANKQDWSRFAHAAFLAYQWAHSPRNANPSLSAQQMWYTFEHTGFPFFVLDTRLERSPRHADGAQKTIVSHSQMAALGAWLAQCQQKHGDKPKFIVSPSVLAPISNQQETHNSSDGWFAYPQSIAALADLLIQHNIKNLVLLSGDLHANFASKVTLCDPQGQTAHLHALVLSPLYAPYEFINTKLEDVHPTWQAKLGVGIAPPTAPGQYALDYQILWHDDSFQGFAMLHIAPHGNAWQLNIASPPQKDGTTIKPCQIDL